MFVRTTAEDNAGLLYQAGDQCEKQIRLLHNRIWNVPALNGIPATNGQGIFCAGKADLVPVYVLEGDSFTKVIGVKQKWEYKQFKIWGKEK